MVQASIEFVPATTRNRAITDRVCTSHWPVCRPWIAGGTARLARAPNERIASKTLPHAQNQARIGGVDGAGAREEEFHHYRASHDKQPVPRYFVAAGTAP